ncbi:MAG: 4Fe-4S binding protein [Candidatus Methanofastidiosa archaeon]|jgi:NAD-dependent dihydropyrimidine dehydrogenase PreA subunit|nr:4Fe-4S binding protein [Candidatus Methanofastidiosa archaeon]
MSKVTVSDNCTGCGVCVSTCPVGVFEIQGDKAVPINEKDCIACLLCVTECAESAITVEED